MYTPRKYQAEAINSVFNYFINGGKGNPLVVAPTGAGKSIIIADLCRQIVTRWKGQKVLIISHVAEILVQNYEKLVEQVPNKTIGLYSAGLGSKTIGDITVAGIQSIFNKPELFDGFNIVIVDECHTIPHKKGGRYHKFFKEVKVPVVGFTATPFRLGAGYLHLGEGAFFSDIVYTIEIGVLQKAGHLCNVTSKGTEQGMDASKIKKQAGDFMLKELSLAFDRKEITKNIVKELLKYKVSRKKWLLFAIDIEHCEHITEELNRNGIKSAAVHSKMEAPRDAVIEAYKQDKYTALVSVAVLTTGFDVPAVDLVALLRPTSSPVLHVQIIGRGLRPSPQTGKKNCLVLDFAGNLLRMGPIDNPVVKVKGKGGGEAVMKMCPNCAEIVHAAVRFCPACDTKFEFQHHLKDTTSDAAVVGDENWYDVTSVDYSRYTGTKGIPMLQVQYLCGLKTIQELICIEHSGYPLHKAKYWWSARSDEPCPKNVYEALTLVDGLQKPARMLINESGQYPDIKEFVF